MNKELIINTYIDNTLLFKEHLLGILKENILTYENERDLFLIDLENNIFQKENKDSILKVSSACATITLKELEKSFDIAIFKHSFITQENKIVIEYLLESQENTIRIEIEMSDLNA